MYNHRLVCTRCGGALAHEDERCRCGGRSAAWDLLDAEQRDHRLMRQGKMFCHDHNRRDDCLRASTAEERGWYQPDAVAPEVRPLTGREARRLTERAFLPAWQRPA